MIRLLKQPSTLWVLFALFVLETLGFGVIMLVWDFQIIDEMWNPDELRVHIGAMTPVQRTVHAWMTATLDVAYPLTYGPLFCGLALRYLSASFAWPAVLVVPTDLLEGFVQVMVLTGHDQLLWLKAYVTPLKLVLFILATLIAVLAVSVGIRRARYSKKEE